MTLRIELQIQNTDDDSWTVRAISINQGSAIMLMDCGSMEIVFRWPDCGDIAMSP